MFFTRNLELRWEHPSVRRCNNRSEETTNIHNAPRELLLVCYTSRITLIAIYHINLQHKACTPPSSLFTTAFVLGPLYCRVRVGARSVLLSPDFSRTIEYQHEGVNTPLVLMPTGGSDHREVYFVLCSVGSDMIWMHHACTCSIRYGIAGEA